MIEEIREKPQAQANKTMQQVPDRGARNLLVANITHPVKRPLLTLHGRRALARARLRSKATASRIISANRSPLLRLSKGRAEHQAGGNPSPSLRSSLLGASRGRPRNPRFVSTARYPGFASRAWNLTLGSTTRSGHSAPFFSVSNHFGQFFGKFDTWLGLHQLFVTTFLSQMI